MVSVLPDRVRRYLPAQRLAARKSATLRVYRLTAKIVSVQQAMRPTTMDQSITCMPVCLIFSTGDKPAQTRCRRNRDLPLATPQSAPRHLAEATTAWRPARLVPVPAVDPSVTGARR